LAQQRGLGLDPAHAPAEDAQAGDHRRVGIGADQGVRDQQRSAVRGHGAHHLAEVLQVDLVADPGRRRDHVEVVEGGLSPAQELVALPVALELQLGVARERVRAGERVDLNAVVHHQIHRDLRVDPGRIPAEPGHGRAHGGQVDHGGHAGEVLQQHPGRLERDLDSGRVARIVGGQGLDVFAGDQPAVLGSQHRLEQDLDRVRQAAQVAKPAFVERSETKVPTAARAGVELGQRTEGIRMRLARHLTPLY
jgi:hypothetical protein